MSEEISQIQEESGIVGRENELETALLAIRAGKHILLEGPVGVGKTVIGLAIARHIEKAIFRIDGDERYSEHKLVGWFDPSSVITKGYTKDTFIDGPLSEAMKEGGMLFINELNRMPEGTQNVLLPAMDERQILIPRIGEIKAEPGFCIVATQNPDEYVATSRLSEALRDRFVLVDLYYQSVEEEIEIVRRETEGSNTGTACDNCECHDDIISTSVEITRKTRSDSDVRRGASIRGAIDLADLIFKGNSKHPLENTDLWIRASKMALTTKIELQGSTDKKSDEIIKRITLAVLEEKTRKKETF